MKAQVIFLSAWAIGLIGGVPKPLFAARQVVSLNGSWEVAEGTAGLVPTRYFNRTPVPGLIEMAHFPFSEVGVESGLREVFWYRRAFQFDGPPPEVAFLKLHKVKYGVEVYLNGEFVGRNESCFVPVIFDVRSHLRANGARNILHVCVGAHPNRLPEGMPWGHDYEKTRYIPGIYDDVELVLSGAQHIANIQAVPEFHASRLRVVSRVENYGKESNVSLAYTVREADTNAAVASMVGPPVRLAGGEQREINVTIDLPGCRPWSPEDPFLYDLEVKSNDDEVRTRWGMREFRFDPETGRALLNGRPYFMRGTNVCIFRFFEDANRGGKPWDDDWVRRLHRTFKGMHWNAMRWCIGFPPERWYRIADEEGFLVQDEFPLWDRHETLRHEALAGEYAKWMEERWNHPCVVIWDAQNETVTAETGRAIRTVRDLDLSRRPWDNGWSEPQALTDPIEAHPYLFGRYSRSTTGALGPLADFLKEIRIPGNGPTQRSQSGANFDNHPIIINEYGWFWLNRDGSPTSLTREIWAKLAGPHSNPEQRREMRARYLAALTEYWRSHRKSAGVLHFCGLGYSRTGGAPGETSDDFVDLDELRFEPHFEAYIRDAFAPVGLMIDLWDDKLACGASVEVPVHVINDQPSDWSGAVRLVLSSDGNRVLELTRPLEVPSLGRNGVAFNVQMPVNPGRCWLVAEIDGADGKVVKSRRELELLQR